MLSTLALASILYFQQSSQSTTQAKPAPAKPSAAQAAPAKHDGMKMDNMDMPGMQHAPSSSQQPAATPPQQPADHSQMEGMPGMEGMEGMHHEQRPPDPQSIRNHRIAG